MQPQPSPPTTTVADVTHLRSADGRRLELPRGWPATDPAFLDHAHELAATDLERLVVSSSPSELALQLARSLVDLAQETSFETVEGADLWACHLHGIACSADVAAPLLLAGQTRNTVRRHLRRVGEHPPITDMTPAGLDAMWDLHSAVRDAAPPAAVRDADRPTGAPHTPRAAQLADAICAIKRPRHYPLIKTDRYEGSTKAGQLRQTELERFACRIQIFAFLSTSTHLRRLVHGARQRFRGATTPPFTAMADEADDLRLLCALLDLGSARSPAPPPKPFVRTTDIGRVITC